jgi:uncharacterized OB-fold protein
VPSAEVPPLPDSRPRAALEPDGSVRVQGWRCTSCGHPLALAAPWCPRCRSTLEPAAFGPKGVVWASTVLRVPLPGREPPYALAYVDLDAGPRVLGHLAGSGEPHRLKAGTTVALAAPSPEGDLVFTAEP